MSGGGDGGMGGWEVGWGGGYSYKGGIKLGNLNSSTRSADSSCGGITPVSIYT